MSICPICGAEVKPRGANKAFPFCSDRCKSIDLGKWLSEDYRVPAEEADDDLAAAAEAAEAAEAERDDSPPKPDMRH